MPDCWPIAKLDEALGLTEMGLDLLTDSRQGMNKQHLLVPLLRQSTYSRLAGYEDVNDAERLAVDPAMRHVVGGRAARADTEAASPSGVGRFETEMLSERHNLTALMNLSGQWIDKVHRRQPLRELILDMDSSVSETYGEQEGSAYNGNFGCNCYHPPCFCSISLATWNTRCSGVATRQVPNTGGACCCRSSSGIAAMTSPSSFGAMLPLRFRHCTACWRRKATGTPSASSPTPCWSGEIEHLLARPVGRPSHKPKVFYHSFQYQAKSWQRSRRVVAKVEWHAGELFPRVGFIVTNLNKQSKNVVKFYNGRGTAEQWIKEGKNAVKWTKLSCHAFKDNQTRLQLFALAYNLANFLRRLALPRDVQHWSLTTLREKLVKIGAKVTRHAKYVTFQLAEVAVPRRLFAAILDRIARLAIPPPSAFECAN